MPICKFTLPPDEMPEDQPTNILIENHLFRRIKCATDSHPSAYWARIPMTNGREHLSVWCPSCEKSLDLSYLGKGIKGLWAKREWVENNVGPIDSLPVVSRDRFYGICYRCKSIGPIELHHVAAKTIYGDLAEEMPIIALCPNCHDIYTNALMKYRDSIRLNNGETGVSL